MVKMVHITRNKYRMGGTSNRLSARRPEVPREPGLLLRKFILQCPNDGCKVRPPCPLSQWIAVSQIADNQLFSVGFVKSGSLGYLLYS